MVLYQYHIFVVHFSPTLNIKLFTAIVQTNDNIAEMCRIIIINFFNFVIMHYWK